MYIRMFKVQTRILAIAAVLLVGVLANAKEERERPKSKSPETSNSQSQNEGNETSADKSPGPSSNHLNSDLEMTPERRRSSRYFVFGSYSPLDLLIPSKYGATAGWLYGNRKTWELEYLRGSVSIPFLVKDLGEMYDQRISIIGRSHLNSDSFNLSYGLSYFDFSLHLGDEILSRVTGGAYPSIDLVRVRSIGFNLALGSRWTLDNNFSFGVDWISLAQPVWVFAKQNRFMDYATNASDREAVDTALKLISYFPRFSAFKLQVGYFF